VVAKFQQKFGLPERPVSEIPSLPNFLDELPDNKLMSLYSEFMAWVSYAKADYVQAEIAEERAANQLRITESMVLITQWGTKEKGDTVTLAKAHRDINPEVIEAQTVYSECRAYRKLVESVFERCERGAQVLSRELSRRIGLAPKEYKQARYIS
jgi:hypothetical protein